MDNALIEKEFPQQEGLIYLNHAGVAPVPARTASAVEGFIRESVRVGAVFHEQWRAKERELREQCRRFINAASANDIALLKNTSEGISIVACGLDWLEGDNVVTSNEEFPSNRVPWEAQSRHGVTTRQVDLRVDDPEAALMAACNNDTRVLAISSVEYSSGLRLDLARLGEYCRKHGILFCVDAIQSLGAIDFNVQDIQADFIMADDHKWLLGPEGIALFYCRGELLESLMLNQYGWHMVEDYGNFDRQDWEPAASARRFECGTANMLGIHAFSASLTLFEDIGMAGVQRRLLDNSGYLIERLKAVNGVTIVTPEAESRRAGIVVFKVEGKDNKKIFSELVKNNVICAHRGGGIRFSPHFYTPGEQLDQAVELVSELSR